MWDKAEAGGSSAGLGSVQAMYAPFAEATYLSRPCMHLLQKPPCVHPSASKPQPGGAHGGAHAYRGSTCLQPGGAHASSQGEHMPTARGSTRLQATARGSTWAAKG